ncbi:MAG: hypothetical protein ACYDBB_17370 [Armatimonadota bacterium]
MRTLIITICLLAVALTTAAQDAREPAVSPNGLYILTDFGDVAKRQAAEETLKRAGQWIRAHGGGMLIVPAGAAADMVIRNNFQTKREDKGPYITILDMRDGLPTLWPTQLGATKSFFDNGWTSMKIERILDTHQDYLPQWGSYYMVDLYNAVTRGSSSILRRCEAVKFGEETRFYPQGIRGIFHDQRMTFQFPGVKSTTGDAYPRITAIRWDPERKQHYFLAEATVAETTRGWLSNKSNVGVLGIHSTHNTDSQSFDFGVWRTQYGHGDTFLISGTYVYQGDVISTDGDEQGHVFNAEIEQDPTPFSGVVEAVDWARDAIIFRPGNKNAHKLGTSRGIINMNREKWLTAGTVKIIAPEEWSGMMTANPKYTARMAEFVRDGIDVTAFELTYTEGGKTRSSLTTWDGKPMRSFRSVYQGRAYPSLIHDGVNWLGGRIIASADCGWTDAVVGRYFAVAEKGEYLASGDGGGYYLNSAEDTYRWYLIRAFTRNPDGTCVIRIERVRYATEAAGAPTLYNADNYTWDGHERPLRYIIAPGAYATDIADGWKKAGMWESGSCSAADPRTIKVIASPDRGTRFDFAPGDPITQAVGADPRLPTGLRIREFNKIPTSWPTGAIEVMNFGLVSNGAGLVINGTGVDAASIQQRKDRRPPYENGVFINTVTGAGIRFGADVLEGALVFEQPFSAQPITWHHAGGASRLTVDPVTGDMAIAGSDLNLRAVKALGGLSATGTAARNLRGINVPVGRGEVRLRVVFATPEADGNYALHVQPNWNTNDWVVEKTATGFEAAFSSAAPAGAVIDWQLIR